MQHTRLVRPFCQPEISAGRQNFSFRQRPRPDSPDRHTPAAISRANIPCFYCFSSCWRPLPGSRRAGRPSTYATSAQSETVIPKARTPSQHHQLPAPAQALPAALPPAKSNSQASVDVDGIQHTGHGAYRERHCSSSLCPLCPLCPSCLNSFPLHSTAGRYKCCSKSGTVILTCLNPDPCA